VTAKEAVHLSQLELFHFRNLAVQKLDFPPDGVAIIGDNGQGKTNLLESIYYLETFRSFRGARDDQLLAFDQPVFRVQGRFEASVPSGSQAGTGTAIAAAWQKEGRRKKVTVDGREPERIGDALGRAAIVVFSPSDVSIVTDGPAERRRWLDIVLSLNHPGYLSDLQRYRATLNQRNAALRERAPASAVGVWDEGLIAAGSAIARARGEWVDRWRESFSGYYEAISGGQPASMSYAPSAGFEGGSMETEGIEAAFRHDLAASRERERRLGTTVVGPHRDDVVFGLDAHGGGIRAREYGSGGQQRTVALCLRLTEAATIRARRGREPIVLMDDVFAELDLGRSERVLELIDREETGQVILTAPKEGDIRFRSDVLARWSIRAGVVSS
jgi:DNA replication and repair protein RecF